MEREGIITELRRFGSPRKTDTYLDPAAFRHVLQVLVDEEGITTLLETPISDVLLDGSRVGGVVVMGALGPLAVKAKVVVDTTPHAVVAALAGRPFPYPEVYTGTYPRVAGVDIHAVLEYVMDNPDDVRIAGGERSDLGYYQALVERGITLRMRGFRKARERAIAIDPAFGVTGSIPDRSLNFFYDRDGCGAYWIHSPEWRRTDLSEPLHLSRTLAEMRKIQWLTHKLFRDYVPGFEKAHLVDVLPHIARALLTSKEPGGFTEYDVPWEHVQTDGDLYEDALVRVRGHHDRGEAVHGWQLPYRSLIPRDLEGLLVTGKPACRVLHIHATNAAVGQAAGVAAALAAKERVPLRELSVRGVQEALQRQGAVVF
jgi:hypothetical protein